ncbi:polysaccharide ABC transporter ATP-binding protein [Legionella worsleiensis]|uniref:ABC transporter of LPS O-antigen n=1 Tax=Legionella worsleiensis TaxID=45076 RepID=A0A0W1A3D7_9GAMM|nr:ABC transporter ATP-binding protein [Legionella worsleiensis]KTD75855.1 ABC transporter of LPS O-antigen [Legionella worsleiensis]STY32868.1 ABC transporter of LPS O-antigen [Legionella worsleiensis]
MNWILRVDNLSKVYRLGAGATEHGTLYEQLSRKIKKKLLGKSTSIQDSIEDLQKTSSRVVVSNEQTEGLPPGYFWALKDINFQISPGERVGLIGQNGSGKSTLLKILSRITAPTHGEFRYRGHLISLLEVGTGFHPELSGRENIYLNAAINGLTRQQINSIFKNIVEFSELGGQIDTPVKRYSSGMYMRLAFSVAAFLESEILLIDEVLAVGDKDFQKKCKEKMLEVANDGRSVIFVSHDMTAIESICKKVIEVAHGRIIETRSITPNSQSPEAERIIEIPASPELIVTPAPELVLPPESVSNSSAADKKFVLCAEQNWVNDLAHAPRIENTVILHSLKLLNDDGETQEKFTVNENIHLEITFKVLTNNARFNLRVDLSAFEGIKLFTIMDHATLAQHSIREEGLYTETVIIPKEFLNEGQFTISVVLNELDNEQNEIHCVECLSMKIIDDQLPVGVRSNWTGAWPEGLLRPKLVWRVEHVKSSEFLIEADINSVVENS